MALAVRIGRGQGPQALEGGVQLTLEPERIEALIERLEVRVCRGREHAGAAQALVGRLGTIVDPLHAGAVAVLGHELLDRLEEVDVQAREPIDPTELSSYKG